MTSGKKPFIIMSELCIISGYLSLIWIIHLDPRLTLWLNYIETVQRFLALKLFGDAGNFILNAVESLCRFQPVVPRVRPFRRQAPSRRIALTTHGKDT